jgi:hypothetical protein
MSSLQQDRAQSASAKTRAREEMQDDAGMQAVVLPRGMQMQMQDRGREGQRVAEQVALGVVRAGRPHVKGKVRCGRDRPCNKARTAKPQASPLARALR